MLQLKEASPWKPQQRWHTEEEEEGGWGRLDEGLFILRDNDTGVHWKRATIKSIKEEY